MSKHTVVSIGGVDYDEKSGLPLKKENVGARPEQQRSRSVHAKGVHNTQQRSTALNRQFVNKAATAKPPQRTRSASIDVRRAVKRSPHISKFARDPQAITSKRAVNDIAHVPHPIVQKVHKSTAVRVNRPGAVTHPAMPAKQAAPSTPNATTIKQTEIGKALANSAPAKTTKAKQPKRSAFNVAAASLGVLLIAGYFTYVNMPNLSVRVAAAQAGIDATYPEYRPIGYRLNGPVSFQNGQVSMNFTSNSSPVAFSLNQSSSNWDSSALLEKYVDPRSEGKYATYSDGGLTVYTYGTEAAWVNGGVLYTVEGDANLSNEQIRRIATSM